MLVYWKARHKLRIHAGKLDTWSLLDTQSLWLGLCGKTGCPSLEHSVLCLLTYTFISDLLSGLAKIVDCFHSCYPFVDKLYSSTFFSACLARSGRPVEPCIQCSCAVGNSCRSECIAGSPCGHAQRY